MVPIGLAMIFVGGCAVWMMHVTGVIPRKFPWKWGGWRREDDPRAWENYELAYWIIVGVGAVVALLGLIAGR